MPSRRVVMLAKESSPGVPKSSPVTGTDRFYLRLGDGTDLQVDPIILEIPHGGGLTTAACADWDQMTATGTIDTILYVDQAPLLLSWLLTRVNTGRTTPWATTDPDELMPPGDLATLSWYEAIQERNGTWTRTAIRSLKPQSFSLTAVDDGAGRQFRLQIQVIGGKRETVDSTEFPLPAQADYPCASYLFSHLQGGLKIATDRNLIRNVTVNVQNTLDVSYFEYQYPKWANFYGRATTLEAELPRKSSLADYQDFLDLAAQEASFELNNGAKWIKIDFLGNNHWQRMQKQVPDDRAYSWAAVLKNKIDAAEDNDLVFTSGVVEEEEEGEGGD